jgi:hypothetical protein
MWSTVAPVESGGPISLARPRLAEAPPAVVQSRVEALLRTGRLRRRLRRVVRLRLGLARVM